MKKFILFAALAAGAMATAAAQEPIKFGARAGLNVDNMSDLDSKVGFHLGGVADIPLATYAPTLPEWFYFQPGLYLSTKGGKKEKSSSGVTATSTISLYYVELPLLASVKFTLTDDIKVRAHFGPSIGVALSGKSKFKATGGGQTESEEDDIFGEGSKAGRFRFGLDFGAGVEYKQLYFGLGYDLGLTNIDSEGDDASKVSTFGISVGYKF
jgi:hypothetical protein